MSCPPAVAAVSPHRTNPSGRTTVLLFMAMLLSACQFPWEDNADDHVIDLSGTVDAREVALGFQVGGRLQALHVDEGVAVRTGQPMAGLEPADYQLALQRAEAELESARMTLAALVAGTRAQELKVAEAAVTQARSELQYAQSEVKRLTALLAKNLASQEQLDQSQLRLNIDKSALDQARHKLELLREGPRKQDIDRAKADLAARQAALDTARRQLGYTQLLSPVDGIVSLRLAEEGEVLAAGQPVLRVTELGKPWVRAWLRESDLARVTLGQAAEVRVDGLPDQPFEGHLSFIAPEAEFTPKTVETRELRSDLVYLIKVEVANPGGQLKVGMPADVILKAGS
jgi:HlyD family secretion protein